MNNWADSDCFTSLYLQLASFPDSHRQLAYCLSEFFNTHVTQCHVLPTTNEASKCDPHEDKAFLTPLPRWVSAQSLNTLVSAWWQSRRCSQILCTGSDYWNIQYAKKFFPLAEMYCYGSSYQGEYTGIRGQDTGTLHWHSRTMGRIPVFRWPRSSRLLLSEAVVLLIL